VAGLIGEPAEYVSCFGSGTIRPELANKYGSPFAVETAQVCPTRPVRAACVRANANSRTTPHPAFGHLLPVEGRRRGATRIDMFAH
jgi:hypothetical protein